MHQLSKYCSNLSMTHLFMFVSFADSHRVMNIHISFNSKNDIAIVANQNGGERKMCFWVI